MILTGGFGWGQHGILLKFDIINSKEIWEDEAGLHNGWVGRWGAVRTFNKLHFTYIARLTVIRLVVKVGGRKK